MKEVRYSYLTFFFMIIYNRYERKEYKVMAKGTEVFEYGTIVLGSALGIAQIESILGIILLIAQLIFLIIKIGIRIYDKIKEKDTKGAIKVIEEGQKELEERIKKKDE